MNTVPLAERVATVLDETPTTDIHTHLYSHAFGDLLLWGIDELLTYHYLVAEFFRHTPGITVEEFWKLPKTRQAELVWDALFVKSSPVSEATTGVITVLHRLGLDVECRRLDEYRKYYARTTCEEHTDRVLELSNIKCVVMTNDPFDPRERFVWDAGTHRDKRFLPALRLDHLLHDFPACAAEIAAQGFEVGDDLDRATQAGIGAFLEHWIEKMQPVYVAASLPPDFRMDDGSTRARIVAECVLPAAARFHLPVALMIGVRKRVNPRLQDAGDAVGKADITVVESLARDHPEVRFLVTMLSRENQHELCVAARKFGNILPFGCWWFLNNPSIVTEITRERLELLGLTVIPQHSDARVLDQLIYKWEHSRSLIAQALAERYTRLVERGWPITDDIIRRDVARLMGRELHDLSEPREAEADK